MSSGVIVDSSKVQRQTQTVCAALEKHSKRVAITPNSSSISTLLLHPTQLKPANTNSRRDGSPFMNLLQCSPLCDSRGQVRYFIGAQVDVSGLALDGTQMASLVDLQARYRDTDDESVAEIPQPKRKDEFQELCELFSPRELSSVQEHGGDLFQPLNTSASLRNHQRSWLQRGSSMDSEAEAIRLRDLKSPMLRGSLAGVYENASPRPPSLVAPSMLITNNTTVPPGPAIPISQNHLHIPIPPNPGHVAEFVPLSHR